jgi:hypothetical protein
MPVGIKATVTGGKAYEAALKKLSPRENAKVKSLGLRAIAVAVQENAAKFQMYPGGKGPPRARQLTSRTGTGRRSIRTNFSKLPGESQVGSDLKYMAAHEAGGQFTIKAHSVRQHTRKFAFGRKLAPFTVPTFMRKAHSATFPKRPWLEPAVDEIVPSKAERIMVDFWERQVRSSK